jgi:hypothetical protein
LKDSKAKYQEGGRGNEKESGSMQERTARAHEEFGAGKLRVQRKMEKNLKKHCSFEENKYDRENIQRP